MEVGLHSEPVLRHLTCFRAKTRVRVIREGLRKDGWFTSKVSPMWKGRNAALTKAERLAKDFFLDALVRTVSF